MRLRGALAALGALLALTVAATGDDDPLGERTGGATTVDATGRNAFSFPLANLSDAERTRFAIGNSFFRRNWVEAGASTTARDGLGPHFIARSCGGCHVQDGRGAPPATRDEAAVALLLRLSLPDGSPEPTYGTQFHNAAVPGVKAEGRVTVRWRDVRGRFADGTPYTLRAPVYGFADLAYGPMARGVLLSPRIAPQLVGVGLLEAIPAAEIERNAAEQAGRPGPIKGVPNRVHDVFAQRELIGRFGWKANTASLAHQTASAFLGDIGITSTRFPDESCSTVQRDCKASPSGGTPEIDDAILADVVFYQAALAPPARRNANDAQVRRGQELFAQAQCAACHRPSYITASLTASLALANQRIWPYTDLLLHDMGDALADHRADGRANGTQWKTPPLWGIGLIPDVNGHQRLLHDGRARGVLEAILWHGGEAEASKQQVLKMSKAEREALVRFVNSL
jgi:CxxC motif-containing protein (DUF1111 family)